jgi:regulatory protein
MRQHAPRQLESFQDLYTAALRALMRRAHSIHEMRRYLERRSEDNQRIDAVVARLREQNYLNDARYAVDYARQHAQARRQGRFRIARELRTRGVPEEHVEAALDSVFRETDEAAVVRVRLRRKLAQFRGGALDEKKLASLYRSLLRAGFSYDVVRSELRRISRRAMDLERPDDGEIENEV